jgi:hypothetical protein
MNTITQKSQANDGGHVWNRGKTSMRFAVLVALVGAFGGSLRGHSRSLRPARVPTRMMFRPWIQTQLRLSRRWASICAH